MPRPGKLIPLIPLQRIYLENSNIRVSKKALEKLSEYLEEYATNIAKSSILISENAQRKTISKSDIILAKKISHQEL